MKGIFDGPRGLQTDLIIVVYRDQGNDLTFVAQVEKSRHESILGLSVKCHLATAKLGCF